MRKRYADSTNSYRQWIVGGTSSSLWSSNFSRFQIGENNGSNTDTAINVLNIGRYGHAIEQSEYRSFNYNNSLVVSDGSLDQDSNKFQFLNATNLNRRGFTNSKIRQQYHDIHMFTRSQYLSNIDKTIIYFVIASDENNNYIDIPDSSAFAFRIMLNFNAIRRLDSESDTSLSGFLDISGGLVNFDTISGGSSKLNWIKDQSSNDNYLSDVTSFNFINLGTNGYTGFINFESYFNSSEWYVTVVLDGRFDAIGSGKLTLVESGFLTTSYNNSEGFSDLYSDLPISITLN